MALLGSRLLLQARRFLVSRSVAESEGDSNGGHESG
jgi:hypothetical protein